MKERLKSLRLWSIVICLLVMAGVIASQAAAKQPKQSPGMPFLAATASQAPLLLEFLEGQVPVTIPGNFSLPDPTGLIGTYRTDGAQPTAGNLFFPPRLRATAANVSSAMGRGMVGR